MSRVICDLPNASDDINGIKFSPLEEGGMISEEISLEMAEHFVTIPGYSLADEQGAPPNPLTPAAPAAAPIKLDKLNKADLVALAAERGVEIDAESTKAVIIAAIESAEEEKAEGSATGDEPPAGDSESGNADEGAGTGTGDENAGTGGAGDGTGDGEGEEKTTVF